MDERHNALASSICRRCGRQLKDDASKQRGFGPECWKKVMNENRKRLFERKK